jgi:hypothetical protein
VVPFVLELVVFGFPDTVAVVTVTPVAFLQVLLSGFVAVEENVMSAQLYNPPSGSPFVTYSERNTLAHVPLKTRNRNEGRGGRKTNAQLE